MTKLTSGDYPFLYEMGKQNNNTPIVEGIANFCDANRAYSNQFNQGWNNLAGAIGNVEKQKSTTTNANETNSGIRTTVGEDKGIYKERCNINGTVYNSTSSKKVSGGYIRVYSSDGETYRGGASVDINGRFTNMNVQLINKTENYLFAYEDTNGDTWVIKVGNSRVILTSCQTEEYELYQTDIKKIFGHGRDSRDANGKLLNTELKNSGAELRYNGMKSIYTETIANTMNLGVGVLIAIIFITKSQ